MKHTKGPWFVSITEPPLGWVVHAKGIPQQLAYVPVSSIANFPAEANARLISAAPDLLEALKKCAAVCAGETFGKNGLIEALEFARVAISKAEGKTQ